MKGDIVYDQLPAKLQDLACSAYGARRAVERYGRTFRAYERSLQVTQWWTREKIDRFQTDNLRRVFALAALTSPFYKSLFESVQFDVRDVSRLQDLQHLPVVKKRDIQAFTGAFSSPRCTKRSVWIATSGTTGSAFRFPVDASLVQARWAIWWRHRRSYGFAPESWHINMTGKPVTGQKGDAKRPYRISWPLRQLVVGMRDVNERSVFALHDKLFRSGLAVITGYPSIVAEFGRLMLDTGLPPLLEIRLVTTGAENTLSNQFEVMRAAFPNARLTDQYGLSEPCINLSRYSECNNLHEDFEFGRLEVIRESGGSCPPGEVGRLIGTGFLSGSFPFLRYDTGDSVIESPEACACGRETRVFERIEGRIDDAVVTTDGRRVMRWDYIFKATPAVREAQVEQRSLGAVVLRLVTSSPGGDALEDMEKKLRHAVAKYIDPALRVEFEYPREIARTRSGKFKAVVSSLDLPG